MRRLVLMQPANVQMWKNESEPSSFHAAPSQTWRSSGFHNRFQMSGCILFALLFENKYPFPELLKLQQKSMCGNKIYWEEVEL